MFWMPSKGDKRNSMPWGCPAVLQISVQAAGNSPCLIPTPPKKFNIVFKMAREASELRNAKVNNVSQFLLASCKTKKYLGRSKTATHIALAKWRIFKSRAKYPEFWKWGMKCNEKSRDHQKTKSLSLVRAHSEAKHVLFHDVSSSVKRACWTGQSLEIFLH